MNCAGRLLRVCCAHELHCVRGAKRVRDPAPRRRLPINTELEEQLPVYKYASESDRPDNRVYSWGFAELGALGNKKLLKPINGKRPLEYLHRPMRLPFAEMNKVTDVACGFGFTLFAVKRKDHQVFGCGLNTDSQLGQQEARRGHPLERVISPVPVQLLLDQPETVRVTRVACGRAHSAVLVDGRGAFTLGNNAYGQCGRPVLPTEDYSSNPTVHHVQGIDEPLVDVVCGQDHTLFLTESGRVYSCGWGADGQTGQGHYDNSGAVRPVVGDVQGEKIVTLACSADCVLAVSASGDVFGWGNSEYSQLSSATDQQQLNVARRLRLNVGRAVDVASAGTMCAVLNDRGEVYVWGFGMLGKGPKLEMSIEPSQIPPPLFGRNEFSPDTVPVAVSSGLYHLVVVTNAGDLYTWGHNRHGTLGQGHTEDRLFPLRVSIPARVKRVACGVDHMVALCREYL